MRPTKVTHRYMETGNLRPVQLLPGQTKMASTVRDVGVEFKVALSLFEDINL